MIRPEKICTHCGGKNPTACRKCRICHEPYFIAETDGNAGVKLSRKDVAEFHNQVDKIRSGK